MSRTRQTDQFVTMFVTLLDEDGNEIASVNDFQANPWNSREDERAAGLMQLAPTKA